jgi:hypothetical protein
MGNNSGKDSLTFDSSTKSKKGPQNLKEVLGYGTLASPATQSSKDKPKASAKKVPVPAAKPTRNISVPADKPTPKATSLPSGPSKRYVNASFDDETITSGPSRRYTNSSPSNEASSGPTSRYTNKATPSVKPTVLNEVWTPSDNGDPFKAKVDAARSSKEANINKLASDVGKAFGNQKPAPASKGLVDQYGLGKKIK